MKKVPVHGDIYGTRGGGNRVKTHWPSLVATTRQKSLIRGGKSLKGGKMSESCGLGKGFRPNTEKRTSNSWGGCRGNLLNKGIKETETKFPKREITTRGERSTLAVCKILRKEKNKKHRAPGWRLSMYLNFQEKNRWLGVVTNF